MGQQQMMTVILVTIVVGLAAAVAMSTFGSQAEQANLDAVRVDLQNMASQMQSYFQKPQQLGGGGNTFTGVTFYNFNFAADTINAAGTMAQNENGIYEIRSISPEEVVVWGYPVMDGTINFSNVAQTQLTLQGVITEGNISSEFVSD